MVMGVLSCFRSSDFESLLGSESASFANLCRLGESIYIRNFQRIGQADTS